MAYLALAAAMTFPLVPRLTSHLPTGAVDLWQNHWNFWWWRQCILHLHHSPYWTEFLFHPTGANAAFHTHSVFNMLVSLPVNLLLGEAAAYNVCVLLSLWLSGFTMWLLARELTREAGAAFLAGLIYAFFPQHMEQTLEHLNLFSIQFMPLALYFFVRLARNGGRREWMGLALAYSLTALSDWHLALKLTVILAAAMAYFLVRARRRRAAIVRDTFLAGTLAVLLTLPVAWPLMRVVFGPETFFVKPAENKGIDPYYLFLPYFNHPLWGALTRPAYARRAYESAGFACFLGFVPVALAMAGCIRRPRRCWLWLTLFAVGLLFALGRHPYFNGRLYETTSLPFGWLEWVPLFKLMRIANRFMIPASLGLAVMAAWGWAAIRHPPRWGLGVAAGLILLEYLWIPYPMQAVVRPGYLKTLADNPVAGAVLDIPFMLNGRTVENMRNQTAHGRPIVGGYLSTLPPEPEAFVAGEPALTDLMGFNPPLQSAPDLNRLAELGIAFIIMHKDRTAAYAAAHSDPRPDNHLFQRKLDTRLGGMSDEGFARIRAGIEKAAGPPIHEDELIIVFALK